MKKITIALVIGLLLSLVIVLLLKKLATQVERPLLPEDVLSNISYVATGKIITGKITGTGLPIYSRSSFYLRLVI